MDPHGGNLNIVLPPFYSNVSRKKEKRKPVEESFPASSENSINNGLDQADCNRRHMLEHNSYNGALVKP